MPVVTIQPSGYTLLVNGSQNIPSTGQPWTSVLTQDGWTIKQEFGRQGSTASFVMYDEHPTAAPSFTPQPLWTIQLIDTTLNLTLFSGVITKPTWTFDSPNSTIWNIDCTDYSYYADAAVTLGDFSYQTSDQIVIALTKATNCGISASLVSSGGFVTPGPKVPRYRAEYIPLSDAWTQVSKLAAGVGKGKGTNLGGVDWGWYVDENLQLHFYPMQGAPSARVGFTDTVIGQPSYGQTTIASGSNGVALPQSTINVVSTSGWQASTGGQITVVTSAGMQQVTYTGFTGTSFTGCSGGTGTMSTTNLVLGSNFLQTSSLSYEYDGQNLRDSVLIWGGNVIGTKSDTFQGNGVQTQWPLTFQILSTNPRLKLTINNVAYTVGIATSDPTLAANLQRTQFVVSQNANGQWFMQTGKNLVGGNQLAPSVGTTIILTYNFQAPVVARVDDTAEETLLGRNPFTSSSSTTFTATTATDSLASWNTNQWANQRVSTGGFTAAVISNTATTLTTTAWYPSTPPNGSVFVVGWSPNAGVFQVAIKDKTILDVGSAQLRASNQLAQYSKLQERITFTSVDNWPGHIKAGDTFLFQSQFIPDSQNTYASQVSGATYFCHSVDIQPAEGKAGYRTYQIMAQRIT